MDRRTLLNLTPAIFLAACTTTINGGAKTWTIDTHKVNTEGTAILQALGSMLAAPSIAVLLGPNMLTAEAALAAAQASLTGFDELTNGSLSTTFDPQKAQATILSFIADAQQILGLVQQIMPKISISNVATQVGNYVSAVEALLSFLQAALGLASVTTRPTMTEEQALQIATH